MGTLLAGFGPRALDCEERGDVARAVRRVYLATLFRAVKSVAGSVADLAQMLGAVLFEMNRGLLPVATAPRDVPLRVFDLVAELVRFEEEGAPIALRRA